MTTGKIDRRTVIAALAAATVMPTGAFADAIVELKWADLVPNQTGTGGIQLSGLVQHGMAPRATQIQGAVEVRQDLDGQTVRLPGYIVPVDYRGTKVVGFLLVPYVGACVHVRAPPANQMVFVTTDDPYDLKTMWEPVKITGTFGAAATSTDLAEVGYVMNAERIEPYV